MSELYITTLKYFHLAIQEFLPRLKELGSNANKKEDKEKLEDMIEAFEDIDSKIGKYNLNYSDPNRYFKEESRDEVNISISNAMVATLSRLVYRLLNVWKEKLERLERKEYLTNTNKEEKYELDHLITHLEPLLSTGDSYVLGKYAHLGALEFPGESQEQKNTNKENQNMITQLHNLLNEIVECYKLGDQELLENKRLEETRTQAVNILREITDELNDDTTKLKYKKLNSGWTTVLKSGFHNRATAESKLELWRIFIKEIIQNLTGTTVEKEIYFGSGKSYDAVKVFRQILKSAKAKIWIEDNFLHPDLLSVLEPYIDNIEIKLLTKTNKYIPSIKTDLAKLKSQYPNVNIEVRENNQCHDRYMIIDGTNVYHSGHSFHDLGDKASQINFVEDEANRNAILRDFTNWWNTGNTI